MSHGGGDVYPYYVEHVKDVRVCVLFDKEKAAIFSNPKGKSDCCMLFITII